MHTHLLIAKPFLSVLLSFLRVIFSPTYKKGIFTKRLLVLFLAFFSISYAFSQSFTTPGAGTWTAPLGVTSVTVEVWGAGGGGQGVTGNGNAGRGGGGSGGGFVKTDYTVVPGTSYNLFVGKGGDGSNSIANNGSASWFVGNTTVNAVGGKGAITYANNTSGNGIQAPTSGNAGGSLVDTYGGNGGNANNNETGGGGSSAGNIKGNNANGIIGGSAPENGFAGAEGYSGPYSNGNNGQIGAGGSGSKKGTGNTTWIGGLGGNGQIKFTYTCPTYSAGTDQTLTACSTTATLAATAVSSPATGIWTVVSGSGSVTTPTSATSDVTGIVPGTPVVLRWTVTNGNCGSSFSNVTITSPLGPGCLNYCTPSMTTASASGDYIGNVTFAGINNTSGDTPSDYTFYPSPSATVLAGSSYPISFLAGGTNSTYAQQFGVWIDYNQNGSFTDAGEFVFATTIANFSPTVSTGTITIPAISSSVLTGTTRMRVGSRFNTAVTASNSCVGGSTYGEYEDYTVTINTPMPCVKPTAQPTNLVLTPSATSIAGSFTGSASANGYLVIRTTSATAPTAPSNGTTYTAGATALGGTIVKSSNTTTFTDSPLTGGAKYWYWIYAFNNACSGQPAYLTTGPLTNNATTLIVYCTATATTDDATGITNVIFNTINNISDGIPAYTDTGIVTNVISSNIYPLSVSVNTDGDFTVYVKAWIDWNNNGLFTDVGEEYNLGSARNGTSIKSSLSPLGINIPSVIGNFKMRIRATYNTEPIPCNNQNYSEAEDYTLNVTAPSPCVTPTAQPTNLVLTPSATSVAGSFTASASANGYLVIRTTSATAPTAPANGTTYTAGATVLGGAIVKSSNTTTFTDSPLTGGTQYWYWVYAFNNACNGQPAYLATNPLTNNTATLIVYCTPTGNLNCTSNDYISNVTYSTINNSTTCNAGGYTNFPKLGVQTTSVIKGASYNFSLSVGPGTGNHGAGVWIDFNQNGSFSDAGEFFLISNTIAPSTTTNISIAIPIGAATGDVRMRVRYANNVTVVSGSGMSCKMNGTYGETEDYTITVLPAIPINITSSEILPICRDLSTTLTATSTASPAYLYTWSPASGLDTTTGATVTATPSQTTTYTVTGTNGTSGSVQKITVTVSPTPKNYTIQQTISPVGATACSEDYVKLDILGMPSPFPFKEEFTPRSYTYTKQTPVDPNNSTIVLGIDATSSSNSSFAGGNSANEARFFSMNDGYTAERDWYLYPGTGVVGTYLPISLDGYSAANFNFKSLFQSKGTGLNRNIYIEISTDTVNWTSIWSLTNIVDNANTATSNLNINLSAYLGSVVYLRFHYFGSGSGLQNWYLDDIIINGIIPPVSWSPNTGLYTDATLTTAYNGGDVTTLYAAPNGSQLYTLSTSISPCSKSTASTLVHTKKIFTALSGNWSTDNNWFPAGSPISPTYIDNRCVNIPNGKSVVVDVTTAIAKSVTVDAGGKLTISKDQALTVTDAVINNGGADNFVVNSDGNLIQINPSQTINAGRMTAQRMVKGLRYNPGSAVDYVYWSSPVAGQQTKGAGGFSPGTPNNRFFYYRESNDYFYETGDLTFTPGRGYAVQAETNQGSSFDRLFEFKGAPNNGDIGFGLAFTNAAHGYNLVGNPYPSNINFEQLKYGNNDLIWGTAWFWTNNVYTANQMGSGYSGNNYAIYNGTGGVPATSPYDGGKIPNGIIKVGQAFIVQAKSVGTLNFRNKYDDDHILRVKTTGDFYSRDDVAKNRFWISLLSPTRLSNSQLIAYVSGATNDFEQDYDAEVFDTYSDLFYSVLTDKKLVIQGKDEGFSPEDKVKLGANFFQAGTYKIELDNAEGIFEESQNIYLKDKQEGIITNLSQGSYTFTATKGDNAGRFEIIYKPEQVLVTEATPKEELTVYKEADNFVVKAQSQKITNLEVFDATGRLILHLDPNRLKVVIPAEKIVNGVYVLKIDQNGKITTRKIVR